ncbi:DNA polymerase I [Treponema bryantii]|uniref:DNA polymerase I n=1 Tax=Treponema bryantii TaxID=163 RepID=A0A1H9EPH1_9SPIR|nr:DNA polymerase I [Treponema bryantii]SEQ27666.1 DNA polymerase I [Treponema bryantii]
MEFDDKTVYVLDSYGLIFRSYFAFINRPLTNPRGENVSALFGFFRNFHFILEHYKPGYIVAAMDSKTKTFRHEMYDQYKATRPKTPEDLHAQIPWICDTLKALGIPVLQCDGYEADDIIATVARKCRETGRTCRILSGDKDLMQLVDETTQIMKPETGANTWKVTGIEGVEAEWGVKPPQLLDLLSLYGDTADNIPGVHGVGVKTASKLLGDYGDLDGIYAHIDEIKGAMQKKLADGKKDAYFSRDLVRLCDTVPCPDIDAAINSDKYTFNYHAAADLLMSFGVPAVAKSYAALGVENGQAGGEVFPRSNGEAVKKQAAAAGCFRLDHQNAHNQAMPDCPSSENSIIHSITQNDTSSYKALTTLAYLTAYIDSALKSKAVSYDSETDGLDTITANILGFSLCCEEGKAVYIPISRDGGDLFSESVGVPLKDALTQLLRLFDADITLVMHNAKFDLKVLATNIRKAGFKDADTIINKILKAKLHDTMIYAWLQNPERLGKNGYSLEFLGETVLGLKGIEFSELVSKGQTFADVPLEKAAPYAAEDADFTLKLYNKQQNTNELFALEMSILPVLTRMELTGIHLDTATLHAYNKELTEGIEQAEQAIYKEVGHEFNIASPKQLQTVLFEERGLKAGKKTKTGYSTDTSVLEELAALDPVPRMILDYREMAKLKSTYVETLPKLTDNQGRIHTDFVQTGTATGRLSCREPNLQNIPVRNEAGRRIRSAFTAPDGKVLISADYAQIELVVLAHLSNDVNMCKAFNEGTDVHKATAALIYGVEPDAVTPDMRRTAKTINFGVIYGMSAFRLANDLGISRTQASMFIDNYFRMYSSVDAFIKETIQKAEQTGYVETIFGRRRPILAINSRNKVEKSAAERIAVNTPVQGSAADIVKKAMLAVSAALEESKSPARLLLQVHDELIFECPDGQATIDATIALIKDKMENAVKLNVPLRVSIEHGKNWGEFH